MSERPSQAAIYSGEPSAIVAMPRHEAVIPTEGDLKSMLTLGEQFIKSGLMPPTIKSAAAAVVLIQKGRELRIPPMQAINGINVIQGRPTCSADLMLALIYRDHGDNAIRWGEVSSDRVEVLYKRRNWPEASTFVWTKDDSARAGLRGGNHDKYPGAMMRARAISAVARMAFNDSIGGMYLPDELEDTVAVSPPTPQPQAVNRPVAEIVEGRFTEAVTSGPSDEQGDQQRALARLHAAGADLGMSDDDIKQFVADLKRIPVRDVPSMASWSLPHIGWATQRIAERGAEWVQLQPAGDDLAADDEATFTDQPD